MSTKNAPTATVATIVPTTASTQVKRGNSTVATPVALVWVTCHNMVEAAKVAGTGTPARSTMHKACMDAGVAYYTTRTQVQAYLKASKGGTTTPTKLPKGVVIG